MASIRPYTVGVPGYRETWPCEPRSACRARGLVEAALGVWGLGRLKGDATLIVSELVGNAVRHSGSSVLTTSVRLVGRRRVRLAVRDASMQPPTMRRPGNDETYGRGLFLVDQLADRWSTEYDRWGKVVWAECSTPDSDDDS